MTSTILHGNCLDVLKTLPDNSVHMAVTSPPYWGLRAYGTEGQTWPDGWIGELGHEPTPQLYVAHIVAIMREVRRVLRDDGVLFLNLGDSYFGSGAQKENPGGRTAKQTTNVGSFSLGVQRATAYDTSDKEPASLTSRDCLCGNLCDVCRVAYRSGKSRNDDLLVPMLTASLSATSHEHKVSASDHSPTSDSSHREIHSANASLDSLQTPTRVSLRLRATLESMLSESYPQLLDECLLRANCGVCLSCARSLSDCVQECDDTTACTCGIGLRSGASSTRMLDTVSSDLAYPHYTTTSLKPKDLVGIPWRVAFALQDDGWWLRQDIIWAKPNPMPESVTDRCTKSHEYMFLLAKSARYYYDAEAIKEESVSKNMPGQKITDTRITHGTGGGNTGISAAMQKMKNGELVGRNRRSVWTITTKPFREAHFATFPPDLVEPCIKAGTSQHGVCATCGAPWERITETSRTFESGSGKAGNLPIGKNGEALQGGGETIDIRRGPVTHIVTTGWRPTCACHIGLSADDLEIIETPTGERAGDDPSLLTGRAGMNRPRGDNEGRRPITRYEQRMYAKQIKESPHRAAMQTESGDAFAHYTRIDKSGARPVPQTLLDEWIARGWISRVSVPNVEPPPAIPATVLDPFNGAGTTGVVAKSLGRGYVGIELNPAYVEMAQRRIDKTQAPLL